MAMQRESLEVLEQANVAPAQARAFVRAIEIELAGAKDTLATKHDIVLLRQDIEVGRAELRREMAQFGAELRGEMAQHSAKLRTEMAQHNAELRTEMAQHSAELRTAMAQQGAELRTEIARQGADLHRVAHGATRQMYFAVLGQMAVMLGLVYFVFTQLR
jgi:hypothetical protein